MSDLNDELRRLTLDKEALAAELRGNTNQAVEVVEKRMDELLITAVGVVEGLILHSDSDSVRAGLAKWVIDRKLNATDGGTADAEFTKLLKALAKQ